MLENIFVGMFIVYDGQIAVITDIIKPEFLVEITRIGFEPELVSAQEIRELYPHPKASNGDQLDLYSYN